MRRTIVSDGFEIQLLKWFVVAMAACDLILFMMLAQYGKRLRRWDLRGRRRHDLLEIHVRLTNAIMVVTVLAVGAIEICVRLSIGRYEISGLLFGIHLLSALLFAFFFITARFFRNGKNYPEMHRIIVRACVCFGALSAITGAYPLYTL